jgi:hypothetical protein
VRIRRKSDIINYVNQQASKTNKEKKERMVFKATRKEHNNKDTGISTYFSIITLNINDLNFPVRRCRSYDQITTQMFSICKATQLQAKINTD